MCDIVVKKFTFAISSPDEFLYKFKILPTGLLRKAFMRLDAQFRTDRSMVCGYMTDFRFFKMAAVRHLGFVLRVFRPPTKTIS